MSTALSSTPVRWLRRGWRFLDATRRTVLNLLLLALLLAGAWWLLKPSHPTLQDKTALVIDLRGALVEQASGMNPRDRLLGLAGGGGASEQTRLRDVLAVLDAAGADSHITHALLMAEDLNSASLPALREVAQAMERFKAAGKPIYAWATEYNQRQYFLAAHASEVWLNPMGHVYVEGYGRQRAYYKGLFDKLGLSAHVVRAGKYKSAAETYVATGPSPETLEAESALWNTLWASTTAAIEKARKQPTGSVAAAIESLPGSLQAELGNAAVWALKRKWVDGLKSRDEMRQAMLDKGAADSDSSSDSDNKNNSKGFRQINLARYLPRIKPRSGGKAVGIVVAQGVIIDGRAGPGTVGGLSTAELIRKARGNDDIAALVLRVDSPGGSATGSELVRRELELMRKAGKPVVVSMAGLAASGGYWISMAADEVIADEASITGSIGVVGVLPSAAGALHKLGVNMGGASTTWLAGQRDPRLPLNPRLVALMQSAVDGVYRNFTAVVARARNSTPEKIHELAQGRVWSGKDALARGLVDRLGSQRDAVAAAAKLAKLADNPRVEYLEQAPSKFDRLLQGLGLAQQDATTATSAPAAAWHASLLATGLPLPVVQNLAQDLAWLAEANPLQRPFAVATHCLCLLP